MGIIRCMSDVIDNLPLLGHIKGAIHYIARDKEGGDNAMKSASRITGALLGGAIGMALGGPIGAMAGEVTGGLAMDSITSFFDSMIHDEKRLSGMLTQIDDLRNNPKDSEKWLQLIIMFGGDALTGYAVGKYFGKLRMQSYFKAQKNKLVDLVQLDAANDLIRCAMEMELAEKKYKIPKDVTLIGAMVREIETGNILMGFNKRARDFMGENGTLNIPTNLEIRFPDADPPLKRPPSTCAEQQAYDKYYQENPEGDPEKTRLSTVRRDINTGEKHVVKRCDNCKAFDKGMGEVPGDSINNENVPTDPGSSKREAANVIVSESCIALLSKVAHNSNRKNIPPGKDSAQTVTEENIPKSDASDC